MDTKQFDTDVPYVETRSTVAIFPWSTFPVGASKFFPAAEYGDPERVKAHAYSFATRAKWCFRAALQNENGVPGVRIWRLEDSKRPARFNKKGAGHGEG